MTTKIIRPALGASAAAVALSTLCLAASGPSAQAATHHPAITGGAASAPASASARRREFTFVTAGTALGGTQSQQVGIFHGAINGGGRDVPYAQSDRVHLAGGGITVKHPDAASTYVPTVDPSTCYVTFTITGRFTLTHGTGRYHGVAGRGAYVGHGYGYVARTKNGSCNLNAEPKSEVFEITATGHVS